MASQSHELNHFKTMVRALRDEIDQKYSPRKFTKGKATENHGV